MIFCEENENVRKAVLDCENRLLYFLYHHANVCTCETSFLTQKKEQVNAKEVTFAHRKMK